MSKITDTPCFTTRIVGPVEAEVLTDGGRWVLYCEHRTEDSWWITAGMIQDSNKRRLAAWINAKRGEGFTDWCPVCQEAHADQIAGV